MNHVESRTNDTRQRVKTHEKAFPTGGDTSSPLTLDLRMAKSSWLLRVGAVKQSTHDRYVALRHRAETAYMHADEWEWLHTYEGILKDVRI